MSHWQLYTGGIVSDCLNGAFFLFLAQTFQSSTSTSIQVEEGEQPSPSPSFTRGGARGERTFEACKRKERTSEQGRETAKSMGERTQNRQEQLEYRKRAVAVANVQLDTHTHTQPEVLLDISQSHFHIGNTHT